MNTESARTDREFEERTKALFDESVSALDGATRSKLTQARSRALEELERGRRPAWMGSWMPAGAVAAAVLAAMVLWQGQPTVTPDAGSFDVAAISDLEILLSEEELDMIEELEFYAWLDEQVDAIPADSAEGGVG